jgi:hypothetical protein
MENLEDKYYVVNVTGGEAVVIEFCVKAYIQSVLYEQLRTAGSTTATYQQQALDTFALLGPAMITANVIESSVNTVVGNPVLVTHSFPLAMMKKEVDAIVSVLGAGVPETCYPDHARESFSEIMSRYGIVIDTLLQEFTSAQPVSYAQLMSIVNQYAKETSKMMEKDEEQKTDLPN